MVVVPFPSNLKCDKLCKNSAGIERSKALEKKLGIMMWDEAIKGKRFK